MSLVEEIHYHPHERYLDFDDGQHNIAVFGLAASALKHEVEIELEEVTSDD